MANPARSPAPTSSRGSIRFRPPRVQGHPTLSWVLLRAFGPPGIATPKLGVSEALSWAGRLGVAARIASRQDPARLALEVGGEEAQAFQQRKAAAVASELLFAATAAQVARVATALDLSLVFLKGFALQLSGKVAAGSRPAADLDLLAPENEASRLQAALLAAGFRAGSTPEMEHQLPPLVAPAGGTVEVHRCLLGVRPAGAARSATFEALAAGGQLAEAAGWPGHFVPRRPVLLAHAAVHGLVQHGYSPDAYAALRLVGDWIDLDAAGEDPDGELAEVAALVEAELSPAELRGLGQLSGRLAQGDLGLLGEEPGSSAAAGLLHHLLAGTLDEAYASALKLEMLAHPLSDAPTWAARLKAVRSALLPSAAELERLYGERTGPLGARGSLGRLGRRCWRPVDLVLRTLRHAGRAFGARRP